MKTPFILVMLSILNISVYGQKVDYINTYFGADFGVSIPIKIQNEGYKTNGLRLSDFEMAIKAGLRIIPLGNETTGAKYILELEARSDNWQDFTTYGAFITAAGGIELWIGKKGYLNVLTGITNLDRFYISARLGLGQFYIQPVLISQKISNQINTPKNPVYPAMLYATIGFKAFSYDGVRYKKSNKKS